MAQEEAAAAPVAAAEKRNGEPQAVAENTGEDLDVLRRRDAAEQDNIAFGADFGPQRAGARLERPPGVRALRSDVAPAERPPRVVADECVRAAQPGIRGDDVDAVADDWV